MRHLIIFLFLSNCHSLLAQQREIITVKKYSQRDGLNSYNVRKIVQDKWGFIWVGTQDGLSRFDGSRFHNYNRTAPIKNRICGTDIREIIEDTAKDLLWVLPGEYGLNMINTITGSVTATIPIPTAGKDDWNISMTRNGNRLWIGTSTGVKIYNVQIARFEPSIQLPAMPASAMDFAVRLIVNDELNRVWVCYDRYGIIVYDGLSLAIVATVPLSKLNDHQRSGEILFGSAILEQGSMLFGTSQGLRRIHYGKGAGLTVNNQPCLELPFMNSENIDCVSKAGNGDVLVAGNKKLFRFDPMLKNATQLEESARTNTTDWMDAVRWIYPDISGNTWLGCQEGIAFLSRQKTPFTPYTYDKHSNTKLDHVRSVYPMINGDILVGLINGIVRIDSRTNQYTRYDPSHLYFHILQDPNSRLLVSRSDGLFVFDRGTIRPIASVYKEFAEYGFIPVNSQINLNDSLFILGSENNQGILVWNTIRRTVSRMREERGGGGLSSSIVNNLFLDSLKRTWVLSDNIITVLSPRLEKERELHFSNPDPTRSHRLFFDMCEAGGYYWIASYGSGILQLDSSFRLVGVLNAGNGLSNDGVYQIYSLGGKKLLVTSNNGLSVVSLATLETSRYYESDGLHSSGFEEVCGGWGEGVIYAGGLNGFTVIDTLSLPLNGLPPVFYFTGANILTSRSPGVEQRLDTASLNLEFLRVPPNSLQATIYFSTPNYDSPTGVSCRYRIIEKDSSWISLGLQRQITLIGQPPGSYTLEVKAVNENGQESLPKSLRIVVEPKWFQTLLFRIAVVLLVAAFLFALYRYRLSQIRAQHMIRKNISSDLHDDIGSTLHTVKVFTHLAKQPGNRENYLDQIEDSLTEATAGLRDMLWVLDDSADTVQQLAERIKKFALPVCIARGIELECRQIVDDRDQALSKTEKRNILLMMKEIVNNSIKYADCTRISISFNKPGHVLCIVINDNGKGFELPGKGHGIPNLFRRSEQIGYHLTINSVLGKGTEIQLKRSKKS